jgi:uncharacterized protein
MNLSALQQFAPQINQLAMQYGVSNIRVFGSVARGDATDASDVDLLVTSPPNLGLRFYGLASDIGDMIGCPVDIVSDKYINPLIAEYVLKEAVPL